MRKSAGNKVCFIASFKCVKQKVAWEVKVGTVVVDPPSTREPQNHVYGWYVIVTLVLLICVGF